MMHTEPTTRWLAQYKRLYLSPTHHARLKACARAARPPVKLIALLQWLIDCEMERRGIDPETLEPRE